MEERITAADVRECAELFTRRDEYLAWEQLAECVVREHQVRIHRKTRPGSDLYDLFATGTLPITCEQLADVNFDVEYRLKWDSYAKEIRVVEALDDAVPQDMVYWLVAFPWPMSNRDYVFLRHRQQTAEGHHVLISKGITSARVAEVSGVVRVEQLRTFFAIRPATNGAHCEFALLYFDDLKGSIPRAIVSWAVSKAIPAFLTQLVEAAEKKAQ